MACFSDQPVCEGDFFRPADEVHAMPGIKESVDDLLPVQFRDGLSAVGRTQCQHRPLSIAHGRSIGGRHHRQTQPTVIACFGKPFQRLPEGTQRFEVTLHHMLARQPIPTRANEQDLVKAALVDGQIQGPALPFPERTFHEGGTGIGVQVDHIVEPHTAQAVLHLGRCLFNGPHPVDAGQPFHRLREAGLREEVDLHRTVQEGVKGTHHGRGQNDVPHAGEPDDQHLRRRLLLLRLGHGRKVTPSKQEAAPFRGRLPPQAIW